MMRVFSAVLLCASMAGAQSKAPPATTGELKGEPTGPSAAEPPRRALDAVKLEGYAKAGYFFTTPASDDALIGSHSGFRLLNIRFGLLLEPTEALQIVASVDGSVARRRELDPLEGNRVVDLKDAYISWSAARAARVRVGQFKAPYNAETLLGDGQLPFITRSVVSDGIVPPEGFTRAGMTLDRQVGVEISSERLGGGLGFRYALAVVNGNGANVLNNDNNVVAPVARVAIDWAERVTLGVNGYFDQHTEGVRPNRLTSNRLGTGADLALSIGGFQVLFVALMRQTTHPTVALPAENALGIVGSLRFLHEGSGLEVGVRGASYEPSSVQENDRLVELVGMVGWRASKAPLRVLAQYTHRLEEVEVPNNSIDVLAQVSW